MGLLEKKVPVFRKRDLAAQKEIKEALDEAGIWNRCSHYEQEEIPMSRQKRIGLHLKNNID